MTWILLVMIWNGDMWVNQPQRLFDTQAQCVVQRDKEVDKNPNSVIAMCKSIRGG